jgi:hypothetical protein
MAAVWSAEQVLALAPDVASAKAGKDLAGPRKWVSLGAGDDLLWGECQGSGASPYQTKIDLGEPAFHCSCPSRKFPCKHALGLFLLWTGQPALYPRSDPPPWVASWLESRAKRSEQKARKEQEKQEKRAEGPDPADAEARKKREAARLSKVAAGLDDLGLWISDLVRHGLAAVQNKPAGFWEEQARRLVDAQAPGLARRLRQIEALPLSGDGWQAALLDRLARVHLAVEGRRRLDTLPADLQAELRSVIGFPVDQDALRTGPGLRDVWQVVGQRVEAEDRLRTQRTWLIGRQTGRPALVLDFAHGAQPLESTLVPGTRVDADLAFFPGSPPLRALVQRRHAPPDSLDALGGHPTLEAAYASYAGALARNPWLELYPMVVEGVVPQQRDGSWWVRDASGFVLPLSPRFAQGWHLLALCGGRPVVLAGEFDGAAFEPLSVFVGGRFLPLAAPASGPSPVGMAPVDAPSELAALWRDAAACALVGVDRRPPPAPVALGPALDGLGDGDPPARLLAVAASALWYGRVGRRPPSDPTPLPDPCGSDDLPECGPALAERLRRILGGQHADFLAEWLELLASSGPRMPDELLTDLLALARRQSDLRPVLRPALGIRGKWLAAQNPEWGFVAGGAEQAEPATVWQTGTHPERLVALRTLRGSDPAHARELLASTWAAEPADERAAFIRALEVGLGMDDEPFLESALDDRSKPVRRASAELLARLPASRFCQRMIARTAPLLRWDGGSLNVSLPEACDAAMARDAIEAKPPQGTGERAWWLGQLTEATPPSAWCRDKAVSPEGAVRSARDTEWRVLLWSAWATAAARSGDPRWATALLADHPEDVVGARLASLLDIVPPSDRDAYLRERLRSDPGPLRSQHPAFRLLNSIHTPLGIDLAREVLDRVRMLVDAEYDESVGPRQGEGEDFRLASRPAFDPTRHDPEAFRFMVDLARVIPPALIDEAEQGLPAESAGLYYRSAYNQFLDRLRFRHEMHQEFAR